MSPVRNCAGVGRTIIACQCMSISPGISVRPPPSMITVSAFRSTGRGVVEIFSILFPRTRRCDGVERVPLFPSKIRTFWNKVTGSDAGFWAAKGSDQKSARAMSVRLAFVFIGACSMTRSNECGERRADFARPFHLRVGRTAVMVESLPVHLEIDLAVNNVHDVAADPNFFAFLAQMDAAGTLGGGALG